MHCQSGRGTEGSRSICYLFTCAISAASMAFAVAEAAKSRRE